MEKEYLEKDLPEFLVHSIEQMNKTWELYEKTGKLPTHWDLDFSDLNSDINVAEVEDMISSEQAWYLREKYLKMSRRDLHTKYPKTNKSFNGANGSKISIIYQNEKYMLKFPSGAKLNNNMSYSNSSIGEYLGSHILQTLGFETQQTILGTYEINN